MFRRIELIDEMGVEEYRNFIGNMQQEIDGFEHELKKEYPRFWKTA